VDYIHGQIRELLTNYGKIDILWYDVSWPLDAKGWESEKMNKMVFELQPDIIVNNRNGLDGDFATPEQQIKAEKRAWESCMTMNDSWGYQKADDNWKSPKTVVRNLISCARDTGNYLLNIGPRGDGSIPDESVHTLSAVGRWMDHNGASIYDTDVCQPRRSNYASFTRNRETLYMHVHFWPGTIVALGGLRSRVRSARLLASGADVKFYQDPFRVRFINLPEKAPDDPVTTIAIECDGEPQQDTDFVRRERPRT
jgi:alpha-L-fucosidase